MQLAFLLLDVYIVLHRGCVADDVDLQPVMEKAHDVVSFLEKPHAFNMNIDLTHVSEGAEQAAELAAATAGLAKEHILLLVRLQPPPVVRAYVGASGCHTLTRMH